MRPMPLMRSGVRVSARGGVGAPSARARAAGARKRTARRMQRISGKRCAPARRRWARVPGVGPARAAALTAAFELGRRALAGGRPAPPIRGPEDVRMVVRDLTRARKEHFVVLLLNARHELEKRETVSVGSLNASI